MEREKIVILHENCKKNWLLQLQLCFLRSPGEIKFNLCSQWFFVYLDFSREIHLVYVFASLLIRTKQSSMICFALDYIVRQLLTSLLFIFSKFSQWNAGIKSFSITGKKTWGIDFSGFQDILNIRFHKD